jgi:DNA uptake protein ComE-like DNA-binding protein
MSKSFWKDYFSFSKKERIAIAILLIIIIVFVILPYFFKIDFEKPVVDQDWQKQSAALHESKSSTDRDTDEKQTAFATDTTITDAKQQLHLFYFDPNTLDESGWEKLGLSDKTIHTIINYRNKGGHFYKAEDIRKIYGLKKEEADALIPYIKIESTIKQQALKHETENKPATHPQKNIKTIDINSATAEDFKALPGIGEVLSSRIVKFRNAIHGFKSVEDIKKTYGLPDSTYNNILPYLTISDSSQKN